MTAAPPRLLAIALALALFLFSVFCLTGSTTRYGYEGFHIVQAEYWARLQARPPPDETHPAFLAGIAEVPFYLPSAVLKTRLEPRLRLISLQNIAYVAVNPLVATLIVLVFFGFVRDLYADDRVALKTTLALAFGTMVWPYAKFGMENHQTLWTLASAWMLLRYVRGPSGGRAALFGAAMGLLALTKITALVHCAALAAAACWMLWRRGLWRRPGFGREAAVAAGIGAAALVALLVSNRMRFDGWLVGNRVNAQNWLSSAYSLTNVFGVLVSPGKSLFLFSPPLLVAVCLMGGFLRRFRDVGPAMAAIVAVALWYVVFSAGFCDETWGPRRLHFALPFAMLPLGLCFEAGWGGRVRRLAVGGVLALGVAVQLLAVSFDYSGQAFVMARHPVYTIDNTVWLPQMSALRFHLHLARSAIARAAGDGPVDFTLPHRYIPFHAPDPVPEPLRFEVGRHDAVDLWWLQERRAWGAEKWWFGVASFYVLLANVALVLVAATVLVRASLRLRGGTREAS